MPRARIMSKIATRSLTAAVTAMVPNSLGPGELLAEYGTQEQKDRWLHDLAKGDEIPCFGLTGPEAGSDAGAIPDTGVICKGTIDGEEVLGMRLNFAKRWITLAPHRPLWWVWPSSCMTRTICWATRKSWASPVPMIPADTEGVEIGRRHYPGSPFMNGPHSTARMCSSLWMPSLAATEMAGKGWRMLIECLGACRGVSLPALATASGEIG